MFSRAYHSGISRTRAEFRGTAFCALQAPAATARRHCRRGCLQASWVRLGNPTNANKAPVGT
eukprot:782204-Lingulodinium_polyedra.AAC.1